MAVAIWGRHCGPHAWKSPLSGYSSRGAAAHAQYLEVESEISVATLHFPVGLYTLSASDSTGYITALRKT